MMPAGRQDVVSLVNHRWSRAAVLLTKRALTAVMFFFTLADTGSPDKLPLITIPAQ
jgi:hypothetical protein